MSYRNLFGLACLFCFITGLVTHSPYAYWGALFAGALSRASVRKGWSTPQWMERLSLFRGTPWLTKEHKKGLRSVTPEEVAALQKGKEQEDRQEKRT